MRRLVIACPNCGAPNAATVAVCVQCGATLKPDTTPEPAPPAMASDSEAQTQPIREQSNPAAIASSPPPSPSTLPPRSFVSQPKPASKGGIASLGSQAVFYVGCAILIVLPILLIGLGPLRVMLARMLQH